METNTTELPTPAEYWDQLDRHDWHYAMSDDYRSYMDGAKNFQRLMRLSHISSEHRELFEAFVHRVKVRLFGGPVLDKPERPGEGS